MKNIYIILILFLSFTIYSCAKKSDTSSTTTTNTELEGTWQTSCHSSGSSYRVKKLTVSGTNFTNTNEYHSDSSCDTDDDKWSNEWGSLNIGAPRSDGSGYRFTLTLTDITYTPQTSAVTSSANTDSWCGETDWVLNTAQSAAGKTCGSGTQWDTGQAVFGEYILDGNNLYWDYSSSEYPSVNTSSDYYTFTRQ